MADSYLTLQTTPTGMNMIIRSLYDDNITFTRIVIGDGTPKDISNVTALANQKLSIGIKNADAKSDYLLLTGETTSAEIQAGFYGKELGVYAKGTDGKEQLYAYRYCETDVDYYPSAESGRTLELTMSVVVQLGNAKNVTAILIEGESYAKKEHQHDASDITTGVLPISRGGTGTATAYDSELAKVRTVKLSATGWSYSEPYTQTVETSWITSECAPVIGPGLPDTVNANNVRKMKKAYSLIDRVVSGAGTLTFYCYKDRPKTDINVYVKGV